jgi:fermentation-respiration switch protein FrsA (DUF1100 family)
MDLFRNYEKMEQIQCPVLVMHGPDDDIVPCRHGSGDLQVVSGKPTLDDLDVWTSFGWVICMVFFCHFLFHPQISVA